MLLEPRSILFLLSSLFPLRDVILLFILSRFPPHRFLTLSDVFFFALVLANSLRDAINPDRLGWDGRAETLTDVREFRGYRWIAPIGLHGTPLELQWRMMGRCDAQLSLMKSVKMDWFYNLVHVWHHSLSTSSTSHDAVGPHDPQNRFRFLLLVLHLFDHFIHFLWSDVTTFSVAIWKRIELFQAKEDNEFFNVSHSNYFVGLDLAPQSNVTLIMSH